MIVVSQIRDISVAAGFRGLIPGGVSILPFVVFVLSQKLESQLLPAEPIADIYALAQYIEKTVKSAAVQLDTNIEVPGVKSGDIATFVVFANEKNLWAKFREANSRN